jgi:hypothetical protein
MIKRIKLPGQPTQKQQLLSPGTKVRLKSDPGSEGIVEGSTRHKVIVRWIGMSFTGKHPLSRLLVVGAVKQPEAPAPRENPYDRLMRKLHADMHVKPQPLTTKEP